ncbi:MAG: S46 family peptidase [Pirellulaceae bacterium]
MKQTLQVGGLLLGGWIAGGFSSMSQERWLKADEGMWLFNRVPKAHLKEAYGFEATDAWLEHLMKSSVRFNSGGSASFVSSDGLVLTNHHVASDTLYKLSTAEHNYNEDGFLAKSLAEEIPAPDLELNQLVAIEEVTAEVNQAVDPSMSPAEAAKARQAKMAEIEKKSLEATGLRSDVVTLYGGGQYHLYRYKKYTDVRLVWAPEAGAAFFGGDADNFEYPRYCLDVTLFRVYEDGKPAKIEHFLKMNPEGAKEGDLVFVSGNPGRTRRIYTADAMRYQRDHRLPDTLNLLRRKEVLLQQYGFGGPEQKRRSKDDLFGIQNSRKAYTGMLEGLQDPAFLKDREAYEAQLIAKLEADPKLAPLATAFEEVTKVQKRRLELQGQSASLRSSLYGIAQNLVLMAAEDAKASTERLREFRDSNRESMLQALYSPAPIYPDLEKVMLADELARMVEDRGGDDPLVATLLDGKSPRARASELVDGTKLMDVAARKELAAGGVAAIGRSTDPMVRLAAAMETEYRRLQKISDELDEIERQAYAKITQAKFAVEGDSVYPDATFTLRLAFGPVKGYSLDGQTIPSHTTMAGAFDHESSHEATDPWVLPESWKKAKDKMKGQTPYNFVSTADIIGGNSGSPVVDRQGNMVGIIFDGNIQSLTADYYYSDTVGRSVSVHIAAVLEALRSIYGAPSLAEQLGR